METLTNDYKLELLNALSDLDIYNWEFEHQLEDNKLTYSKLTKVIETENLNISITFEETAIWSSYDYYEVDEFDIIDLEVVCENGVVDTHHLSNSELLKYIKY